MATPVWYKIMLSAFPSAQHYEFTKVLLECMVDPRPKTRVGETSLYMTKDPEGKFTPYYLMIEDEPRFAAVIAQYNGERCEPPDLDTLWHIAGVPPPQAPTAGIPGAPAAT